MTPTLKEKFDAIQSEFATKHARYNELVAELNTLTAELTRLDGQAALLVELDPTLNQAPVLNPEADYMPAPVDAESLAGAAGIVPTPEPSEVPALAEAVEAQPHPGGDALPGGAGDDAPDDPDAWVKAMASDLAGS